MLVPDINTGARARSMGAFPVGTTVRDRNAAGVPGVVVGHLSNGHVVVEVRQKAQQVKPENLEGLS
jgi:hypothetical protein